MSIAHLIASAGLSAAAPPGICHQRPRPVGTCQSPARMVSDGTPREPGSTVAAVRIILCPPGITTTRATLRNDAATDIRDIRIKRDSHVLREGGAPTAQLASGVRAAARSPWRRRARWRPPARPLTKSSPST